MADFEHLANELFLAKIAVDMPQVMLRYKVEYRKGKTLNDVVVARDKALKRGNGCTIQEMDWFSLYLKDVFKNEKVKK